MPYIKQFDRKRYDNTIAELVTCLVETSRVDTTAVFPGHLNYIFTKVIKDAYNKAAQMEGFKLGYHDYNEIVGMLECCKQEFIRRVLNNYEDKKIEENGDV